MLWQVCLLTIGVNWPLLVWLEGGGLQDLRDGQLSQSGVGGGTQSGRGVRTGKQHQLPQ